MYSRLQSLVVSCTFNVKAYKKNAISKTKHVCMYMYELLVSYYTVYVATVHRVESG